MRSAHGLATVATGHRRLATTLQSMGWGQPAVWADEDCDVFTVLLRLHISTLWSVVECPKYGVVECLLSSVVECLMSSVVVVCCGVWCCGVLWCLVLCVVSGVAECNL